MILATVCVAVTIPLHVTSAWASPSSDPGERPGLGAYTDHDSAYVWGHRGAPAKESSPSGRAALTTEKARLVRTYVPACQGNLPQTRPNIGSLCAQAAGLCASTPDPNDVGYWVYIAPAGPPAPGPGDWSTTGQVACRGGDEPEDEVEPVVTAADFRRLPLPAAGLKVQPPSGRTLINIPTNLYAQSRAAILPTTILGFPVRVRATPERFRWRYGDGTALSTRQAGGPYPQLDTAHTYRQPGAPTVRLSTTYSGEYSVAGGPWLPIDGEATVASPPATLTVQAAENHLVADPLN